jgi:hypothetical protein
MVKGKAGLALLAYSTLKLIFKQGDEPIRWGKFANVSFSAFMPLGLSSCLFDTTFAGKPKKRVFSSSFLYKQKRQVTYPTR